MSPTTTLTGDPSTRRRTWNRPLWVLQAVAGLGFVNAAIGKVTGDPHVMATFGELGWGAWTRYLLAALEVLGAFALLLPRLAGVAALAFIGLTAGAVVVQLTTGGELTSAVVLLVVSTVIAWGRRRSTTRLWADVRRGTVEDAEG